jgi:ABC-type multidrug transport system fused ATPase/permease subunit
VCYREALRKVRLDGDIKALPLQLLAPVMEKGANFSMGQRQLICIARALVRKSRIIVMVRAAGCDATHAPRLLH